MNIFNDFELLDFINLDEIMWEAGGTQETTVISTTASLLVTGHAPSCVTLGVVIPAGSISIQAYAPTQIAYYALIPTAHIDLSGHAPIIGSELVEIPSCTLALTGYAPSTFCVVSIPQASLTLTGYNPLFGPAFADIPAAGITLTGHNPSNYQILNITAAGSLVLAGFAPSYGPAAAIIPLASGLEIAAYSPTQSWSLGVNALYKKQTIFQCILTGAADGLDDLIIPISSFQSTVRDGDPTYLACVIPDSINYIADISARTNGDIIIKQGYKLYDGSIQAEEIIRVDYENLQDARGGRSASATISGHKTTSSSSPKSVELEEVTYYGLQVNGKRTFRAKPDIFLRVGDTAVYGTESIIIGQISYTVDTRQAIMQVTEA